jgi:ribosomal protein S18 acetylase RimI-like enzyme
MVILDLVTPQNALVFKQARLTALRDTPSAFSATYDAECRLTDAEWVQRASAWSGGRSTAYLAMDTGSACGIVGGFLDPEDEIRAQLVSMWVAPSHRRAGVGSQLVNAIADWARAEGAGLLRLVVTSNNHRAIQFYQRLGFAITAKIGPYRNDPLLDDFEMIRALS